jgi:CubicO group peptidase (beta-lactamase class C family)
MNMRLGLAAVAVFAFAAPASAMTDSELRALLEQRFAGDRTGACVAAAVVEQGRTSTAYVCADPKTARPFDGRTAYEIGSVTKTMTAALLADLILKGEVSLDDPLAKLLPPGTKVATFNGEPISLKHVVTHTSGLLALPPRMTITDMRNPYARITEQELLQSLAEAKLASKPGTKFAYSNFAMMVLSYALAKRSGKDFETLMREKLFTPLGMKDAYIAKPPVGVRAAQGHMSTGAPTSAWDMPVDMAGVGGVRATLPDEIAYVRAHYSRQRRDRARGALTQNQVIEVPGARRHELASCDRGRPWDDAAWGRHGRVLRVCHCRQAGRPWRGGAVGCIAIGSRRTGRRRTACDRSQSADWGTAQSRGAGGPTARRTRRALSA